MRRNCVCFLKMYLFIAPTCSVFLQYVLVLPAVLLFLIYTYVNQKMVSKRGNRNKSFINSILTLN